MFLDIVEKEDNDEREKDLVSASGYHIDKYVLPGSVWLPIDRS